MGTRLVLRLGVLILPFVFLTGCALHPVGKVALTPVTVVRDVVDAPLVSLTNVFETFAEWSNPRQAPTPWIGWDYRTGFNFGLHYTLSYGFFKALSGIFGGLDYVLCRSLFPQWPNGVSPWLREGQGWGDLYFPNTRSMWGNNPAQTIEEARERRAPPAEPPRQREI